MTLGAMKTHIMFQTNNDADDIGDYTPHIVDYINEGYDRVVKVWAKVHTKSSGSDYPPLSADTDVPNLPEWTHRYIADWATWLIYRNGNPQKQQRGYAYRESFDRLLSIISDDGGLAGLDENGNPKQYKTFFNIPR